MSARNKAPVFVLGCSRSGTTLLYHMLLSSGNFAVYRMESQVFNLLEPRFRPLSVLANRRRMLDAWYKSRLYTRTELTPDEVEPRVLSECQNGGDFLRIVMEAMCRKQGVERWAETTPDHLLYLDWIKQTIPEALVIHVIRDGRDVALSWEKKGQIKRLPTDRLRPAMAAGVYWEWIVSKGQAAGKKLGGDYLELHYEDVVQRPKEVLARVEPFIEHRLDHEQILRVAIGSVAAPNTAFQGESRSPIGRWKTDLPADELEILESLIAENLQRNGYTLSTPASKQAGLARMKAAYRKYFATKLWVKTRTPVGKWLVTRDLSWV
ncbi:MAG TPA: sulfotransferase [Terriglobales bacterium]|nr:sulfotransferase [Terriglobales bacterium]